MSAVYVGAAVVSYAASEEASKRSAETQRNAAEASNNMQMSMYDQQRADAAPFRQAGARAVEQMEDPTLGVDLHSDPGYQFRMNQGVNALDASASARGNLNSGAQQKALLSYGQNLASQEYQGAYDRQFNRLSQLAGIGTGTNTQMMNASGQAGQNYANNQMNAANAQAAATMGQNQNFSNMMGQGMMAYGMQNKGGGAA